MVLTGMQDLILLFPFNSSTPSFCNFVSFSLGVYVRYLYLNSSLIHLLRILASLELLLYHEFYSRHQVLTDVYNGKTVLGEKLFASYKSVFELARGLRDSQTSINNKGLGLLVKCVLCFGSLFCDLSTNSFILYFLWVSKVSENV